MVPRRLGVAAATSMFHVKHWRMRRGKGGDALRMRSDGGGNKPRHLERAACRPSFEPQGWRREHLTRNEAC